jgi:hypothetical protein
MYMSYLSIPFPPSAMLTRTRAKSSDSHRIAHMVISTLVITWTAGGSEVVRMVIFRFRISVDTQLAADLANACEVTCSLIEPATHRTSEAARHLGTSSVFLVGRTPYTQEDDRGGAVEVSRFKIYINKICACLELRGCCVARRRWRSTT